MENKSTGSQPARLPGRGIDRLFKLAVIFLGAFVLVVTLLVLGRLTIYKIHPYERGLHLRGGMYLGTDQPGWHAQIPFWTPSSSSRSTSGSVRGTNRGQHRR